MPGPQGAYINVYGSQGTRVLAVYKKGESQLKFDR